MRVKTTFIHSFFFLFKKKKSKLITIKCFNWLTALIFSYLFDSSRCLCVFWLLILSNCYLCFAVTLATRGPRAAAAETEGQRGKMAHLRCLSCQRTIMFDYGSELIYIYIYVCACGYRCSSRNWLRFDREKPTWRRWRLLDPERKENWILLHLGLTQRYQTSLPHHGSLLPFSSSPSVPLCALFKSFSSCWAGLRCQVVLQWSQIVTNCRKDSLKA